MKSKTKTQQILEVSIAYFIFLGIYTISVNYPLGALALFIGLYTIVVLGIIFKKGE